MKLGRSLALPDERSSLMGIEQIGVGFVVVIPTGEAVISFEEEISARHGFGMSVAEGNVVAAAVAFFCGANNADTGAKIGTLVEVAQINVEKGPSVIAVLVSLDSV